MFIYAVAITGAVMIVALLVAAVITVVLVITFYRRVDARLDAISRGLGRIESAIGAEEWVELLEGDAGMGFDEVQPSGIIGRLDRIGVAVDPMARARHEVTRLMRELDDALAKDPSNAHEHWQVGKIRELLEKGERPERAAWESWIKTPFPWA